MHYYSLVKNSPNVDFRTAAITGQAPDRGLYFPNTILKFTAAQIESFKTLDKASLAFEVMKPYVGGTIDDASLKEICAETINFDFPLVPITENILSLELFHGPTLAFKDVGARFMSRCLGYFSKEKKENERNSNLTKSSDDNATNKPTTVLVATSGDTGGAVANGFLGVDGVNVIILYPKGKVSPIQELQLTTCGQNITALEVEGSFDDCQAIVKEAFIDADLNEQYNLTSANSINVARWLPQQLYYFFAWQNWVAKYQDAQGNYPAMNIVVPSGNFGNICAGMMAKASGLPLGHFIAACNANDVVTRYLTTEKYEIHKAVATVSNAMDVGNPSNFVRILEILENNFPALTKSLSSYSINDTTTKDTIARVYKTNNYTLDPHGAVAFAAAEIYLANLEKNNTSSNAQYNNSAIILETAHPVKFPEVVEEAIGQIIAIPESVKFLLDKKKVSIPLAANYTAFKNWMINLI
ncbi:MAG: threonine synthase [Chitinophagaceae bacterium]|nr:threonine synthase [Chitinophagaceae bacterium]